MWAAQSHGDGDGGAPGHSHWPKKCLLDKFPDNNAADFYSSVSWDLSGADDVARFRRWVRATAGVKMHILSYRSYLALHYDPAVWDADGSWDDGQYLACLGSVTEKEEERMRNNLVGAD